MVRFQWSRSHRSSSLLLCYVLVVLSSLPRSKAWTILYRHQNSRLQEQDQQQHALSLRRIAGLRTPLPGRRWSNDALQPSQALMRDDERSEETPQLSIRDSMRRKTIQSTLLHLLLVASLSGTTVFSTGNASPCVANAEQQQQPATTTDPFATFGEQLLEDFNSKDDAVQQQQQRWPYGAASPLPPNTDGQQQKAQQHAQTDMERALQKAKEQKRIDPRTHG